MYIKYYNHYLQIETLFIERYIKSLYNKNDTF